MDCKPCAITWIPAIPAHWQEMMLFQCATEQNNSNKEIHHQNLLSLSYGKIVRKDINTTAGLLPASFDSYQVVNPGNIIMRLTDLQNDKKSLRTGLVTETGIITSAYTCLSPRDGIKPEYLQYLLHSFDTHKVFYGMGGGVRQSIGYADIRKMLVVIPPYDEHCKISQYLSWTASETAHLIKEKRREIRLLRELRRSIINNAVTHGIDSNVEYKNSGHGWINTIPKHWQMLYSKKLFRLRMEKALPTDEQLTASQKYGIIAQAEFMRIENRRLTVVMTGDDILKHVEAGDFVISMRSFQGGIEYSHVTGKISSAYVMLIPNHELVYDRYFRWLLKSPSYIKALQGTSDLVRDGQALRYANFAKVYLPQVPLDEQEAIADYLDEMCPKIDAMIDAIHAEIALVQELRAKTISDVVSGKVDVRDVEIPQYEPESDDTIDDEEETDEDNNDAADEEVE